MRPLARINVIHSRRNIPVDQPCDDRADARLVSIKRIRRSVDVE
jgi:hypothetical protein